MRKLFLIFGVWCEVISVVAGDSSFTRVTGASILQLGGVGVVWGDFDKDGFPDVFIGATTNNPNQNSPNQLFRNERDGTFRAVPVSAFPPDIGVMSAGFVDFDNDGWPDLYGSKIGADILNRNNGDGTFMKTKTAISSENSAGVGSAWGDFDNDGWVDLFVANEGGSNALFQNDRSGGFVRVTNAIFNLNVASQAGAWADYDNDGWLDLFVANYLNNRNLLYHNEGYGRFKRVLTGAIPAEVGRFGSCVWGDFDNDGYFDLFVGSYGPNNVLYHNNRDGSFTKITNDPAAKELMHCSSVATGDYDNDGWLDLMVSGSGEGYRHAYLYHNNGNGSFTKVTQGGVVTDAGEGRTCAFVDYDRDGCLDIWIAHTFGNRNALYRNDGNGHAWLDVSCDGRVSNRLGIGAKIRMKTTVDGKDLCQLRQITASENYAHFGVGSATNVSLLRVEWPSGSVQEFRNVAPRQALCIREPSQAQIEPQAGNRSVSLGVRGAAGTVYWIERSADLVEWAPWKSITNSEPVELIKDIAATDSGGVFYRVQEK